ncbi:hypothetical protein [Rickettsia endosymbiont of Culicoides newsteadi]|uniref:hypothetical protein n=1 Tax=Rickettsia endosymbiont of Culicoides newsteadi TaxID=1961830 RepID=UPI001054E5D4|nr:hypothetical protein [Rickettsia endosymbiont of Culicoides newsteadi]
MFNKNAWRPEITGIGGGAYYVAPNSSSNQHSILHSVHPIISTTTTISNSYSTGFDRYPSSHSYPGTR